MSKSPTYQLHCNNCGADFTITFTNKNAHIGEYAMALEQKLSEPCPECGETAQLSTEAGE